MSASVRGRLVGAGLAIILGAAAFAAPNVAAIPSSYHCSVKSSEPNVIRYNASGQGQPIDHVTYWIIGSGIDLKVFDGAASTWINGAAWNLPGGQTYRLHYREVVYGYNGYTLDTDLLRCGPVPGPSKVAGKPAFKTNTSTSGLPPAPAVPTLTPTPAPTTAPTTPPRTPTPQPAATVAPSLVAGTQPASPGPSSSESIGPSSSADSAVALASESASNPVVNAAQPIVTTTSSALPTWLPYALVGLEILLLVIFLLWDREGRRRA